MSRDRKLVPNRLAAPADVLDDFIASLDELNDVQLLDIHAAWRGQDMSAHEDAWTAVIAAAAVAGLTAEVEQARSAALDWACRGTNLPWPQAGWAEDTRSQIRRQAAPALADAAVAMILADRLDEASGETLIGPWRNAASAAGQLEPEIG
jgi:hypothetical protein